MNPLFEKYFRGQLTEAEESALEALLVESEEAAWEFGQAAQEAYVRYGLPEPKAPGGGSRGGSKAWLLLLLFLGVLGLGAAALTLQLRQPPSLEQVHVLEAGSQSSAMDGEESMDGFQVEGDGESLPRDGAPQARRVPNAGSPLPQPVPGRVSKGKVSGSNLRVVVRRQSPGPVVVRVLDAQGREIRGLYDGVLEAGRWAFEWDGRSEGGKLVDPGKYRIQVSSEGKIQNRDLTIR